MDRDLCECTKMDNRPIGIFDSGMGGLTVRAEIALALPHESLVYFGDGANVPYGGRPESEIIEFTSEAVARLITHGVKMVVVACNAATGAAIDRLRTSFDIPIIGMEPAVKPAALSTLSGTIGVLATAAALNGELYRTTASAYRDKVCIIEAVGEGFVELVENGLEGTPEAIETVRRVVAPMLDAGADRIVLGCTHYPFLGPQIRHVIDERGGERDVRIVDSGAAIARRVGQLLTENDLHASPDAAPKHEFMSFAGDDYTERLRLKSGRVPLLEK